MALANRLWGAPRIHGELLKLGLHVSQRTVARLMPHRPKPPSQTWRTFLQTHVADLASVRYLLCDRDRIYGAEFRRRVQAIGIAEVLAAPRSPWQNPFVERMIGTIRRELLDHVIVLNEGHLRRRLRSYFRYHRGSRTHLALEKDAPEPRAVEPPEHGRVVALPQVGGLHHRYVRRAA